MPGPDDSTERQAVIGIARRNIMKDLVRSYTIFIDRRVVGRLWAFQSGYYAVMPGRHQVCVRVGRVSVSVEPQVEFDITDGEVRLFGTGSKRLLFSWRSLLTRSPEWEAGPWIPLEPMTAPSRSEIPMVRVSNALETGSVSARTNEIYFRKVARGYSPGDVDKFLKDVSARRQSGESIPMSEFEEVTFHTSARGYDMGEVDAFIAYLAKRE